MKKVKVSRQLLNQFYDEVYREVREELGIRQQCQNEIEREVKYAFNQVSEEIAICLVRKRLPWTLRHQVIQYVGHEVYEERSIQLSFRFGNHEEVFSCLVSADEIMDYLENERLKEQFGGVQPSFVKRMVAERMKN